MRCGANSASDDHGLDPLPAGGGGGSAGNPVLVVGAMPSFTLSASPGGVSTDPSLNEGEAVRIISARGRQWLLDQLMPAG